MGSQEEDWGRSNNIRFNEVGANSYSGLERRRLEIIDRLPPTALRSRHVTARCRRARRSRRDHTDASGGTGARLLPDGYFHVAVERGQEDHQALHGEAFELLANAVTAATLPLATQLNGWGTLPLSPHI